MSARRVREYPAAAIAWMIVAGVLGLTYWKTHAGELAGRDGCERLWESRAPSPDSSWVAVVHQDVCDVGLGSAVDLLVDLRRPGSVRTGGVVLSPAGQWKNPDAVKVTWLSPRLLEISVPNRTMFGVKLSRYKDVAIQLRYRHDNPRIERGGWRGSRKTSHGLRNQTGVPNPVGPPLSDSDQTAAR